jgi:hypothetical protein
MKLPLALAGPALLLLALRGLDSGTRPRAGEPLALRWTRTASAHPWRTGLALVLLATALRPPRGSPKPRNLSGSAKEAEPLLVSGPPPR